jgi:hypothetical protein
MTADDQVEKAAASAVFAHNGMPDNPTCIYFTSSTQPWLDGPVSENEVYGTLESHSCSDSYRYQR